MLPGNTAPPHPCSPGPGSHHCRLALQGGASNLCWDGMGKVKHLHERTSATATWKNCHSCLAVSHHSHSTGGHPNTRMTLGCAGSEAFLELMTCIANGALFMADLPHAHPPPRSTPIQSCTCPAAIYLSRLLGNWHLQKNLSLDAVFPAVFPAVAPAYLKQLTCRPLAGAALCRWAATICLCLLTGFFSSTQRCLLAQPTSLLCCPSHGPLQSYTSHAFADRWASFQELDQCCAEYCFSTHDTRMLS
jgi:hypothetical protein